MLDGLAVIPRREVGSKGHRLTEIDLGAILQRRPQLMLIDELAATRPAVAIPNTTAMSEAGAR